MESPYVQWKNPPKKMVIFQFAMLVITKKVDDFPTKKTPGFSMSDSGSIKLRGSHGNALDVGMVNGILGSAAATDVFRVGRGPLFKPSSMETSHV